MTIQEIKDGENLTLQLGGRLDTTTAPDLEKVVNSDLDDVKNLVLDMKELKYVSSAGLRVLLTLQKKMIKQGSLKLLNVCDEIKEVLDITGFTSFLKLNNKKIDHKSYSYGLSFIVIYSASSPTYLYAGRMILFANSTSSIRCAHQPGTRLIAKIGVNSSSEIPKIL